MLLIPPNESPSGVPLNIYPSERREQYHKISNFKKQANKPVGKNLGTSINSTITSPPSLSQADATAQKITKDYVTINP